MHNHQKKKKIPCEMCGQLFSFQGQIDQHKIVHRTIKTHKCMANDCGRWFMRKADLTVHAETHNKKEYKCMTSASPSQHDCINIGKSI